MAVPMPHQDEDTKQYINPYQINYLVQKTAYKDKNLKPSDKLIFSVLLMHCGKEGIVFPNYKTIAEEVDLNQDTVRDSMKRLEDNGYISRQERFREDGSRASNRIYFLNKEEYTIQVLSTPLEGNDPSPLGQITPDPLGEIALVEGGKLPQTLKNHININIKHSTNTNTGVKEWFLKMFDTITEREFRLLDTKTERQLYQLTANYSRRDIVTGVINASLDMRLREELGRDYLTPEYITRLNKFQDYLDQYNPKLPALLEKYKEFSGEGGDP